MRFSLSTNWCNRTLETGEEIADKALELGFDALELGFMTPFGQLDGFKRRLDEMPVESVHAFCPVPVSAPCGSPELYSLFSADENVRAMAKAHLLKTLDTAESFGAASVVLHAGRVPFNSFFSRKLNSHFLRDKMLSHSEGAKGRKYQKLLAAAFAKRQKRVDAIMPTFMRELEGVLDCFEKRGVVLAMENLPFLEGFPNEVEMLSIAEAFDGAPLGAWFDTGHHHVREMHGWVTDECAEAMARLEGRGKIRGMHLNDVKDYYDDHFAPGGGSVEFSRYASVAACVEHVVFEPKGHVSEADLRRGMDFIRNTFKKGSELIDTVSLIK